MTNDLGRWVIVIIVAGASAGGLYYEYQSMRPCVRPVEYAIGAVDPRFGVSTSTLMTEAALAGAIWNEAAGKSVLVYDPEAKMKINFVYDEREANAKKGSQITLEQDALDAERSRIDTLEAQFKSRQDAYNSRVKILNARGGATKEEAVQLDAEKASLQQLASTINSGVASYNAAVKALNGTVNEYNRSAGRTFEEGQYVRDSAGERINIFEFIGTTQLERVLAHEFGHAIGLDHNDNPKSIMAAKNESGNLVPTKDDLAALATLCGA
ncbi:MAG: matrixin family metalloprotease [Parcubacteria group bacterium]|nr:matrixin family metalloprotease [Parcubacteria group bacterium]